MTTPASRASFATEGSKFLGTFLLSAILIYLVLAAQFESFRDPFIILAGSVPLAISGALLFSFLGLTTLNIYSQVGLITLVGLVSKNGILIVEFANHLQETGKAKLAAIIEAADHPIAADSDDHCRHRNRPLPSGAGQGARSRRPKQHRHHAGQRHDHRNAVYPVCRALDLHAGSARLTPTFPKATKSRKVCWSRSGLRSSRKQERRVGTAAPWLSQRSKAPP